MKESAQITHKKSNAQIYIMTDDTGLVKVGLSMSPSGRLRHFKVGNPSVKMVYTSRVISNCNLVERNVHKSLSSAHVSGEWFSCSVNDAVTEVNKEIRLNGAPPVVVELSANEAKACGKLDEWKQLGCSVESMSLENYKVVEWFIKSSDGLSDDFFMLSHARQYLIASDFFASAFLMANGCKL